jgi:hypothetical protein
MPASFKRRRLLQSWREHATAAYKEHDVLYAWFIALRQRENQKRALAWAAGLTAAFIIYSVWYQTNYSVRCAGLPFEEFDALAHRGLRMRSESILRTLGDPVSDRWKAIQYLPVRNRDHPRRGFVQILYETPSGYWIEVDVDPGCRTRVYRADGPLRLPG